MNAAFDAELLACLTTWQYTVFSVMIDKEALQKRYYTPAHPYHYALEVLLERYVKWLEKRKQKGDVMAEARGGAEDKLLAAQFGDFFRSGTDFVGASRMQARLTSRELKLKRKLENVAGLQLAEILAQPCHRVAKATRAKQPMPSDFCGQIGTLLLGGKYDRGAYGQLTGYGMKWLP